MPNTPSRTGIGAGGAARGRVARAGLVALALAVALASLGCYNTRTGRVDVGGAINFKLPAFTQTGSHAVQAFTEMHYQPSYRTQEGPRILPPEGSVPVTGKEVEYDTVEAYQAMAVPGGLASDAAGALARGQHTYEINCLVCHGQNLRGEDGSAPILGYLGEAGARPRNLVDEKTDANGEAVVGATNTTDGELYAWITYGGQAGFASALRGRDTTSWMPPFGRLLTEEERWELVMFIRAEQGR